MQHALSARAASFGAATAIIGAAVFAALSISYTVKNNPAVETPTVIAYTPPIVTPPPETTPQAAPRQPDETIIRLDTPVVATNQIESAPEEWTDLPIGAPALGPVEVTRPVWLRRPDNVARFYPSRAIQRDVEGQVRLDCIVAVRGVLNCSIAEETPPGWGFGEAALRIAREYRMSPALRDGVPVEGRYRMIVPFNLD